jgi:hypothetical protein
VIKIQERLNIMKWKHQLSFSSLTIIAGVAIILPMSAFAEDQNQDGKKEDKKEAADQRHKGKPKSQASAHVATSSGVSSHGQGGNVQNKARVNNASSGQRQVNHVGNRSATVQRSNVSPVTSQNEQTVNRVARSQRNQTQVYSRSQTRVSSNQQQYTRSNNYGGLWFPENTHRDWDRNGEHYWNRHHYRWYEGGWLIIDAGFSPYYSNGGSIASSVQMRLADQGYYRGPIDGDIGPGSRNAIANYQSDYGLRVTGRINDPLLQSLGLE